MSASLPGVSVVVAVYQAEATLEDCIASLLALDYPEDRRELLFVDNNSTDGSAAILARHADHVRVLTEPRQGPAAARNRGIGAARNEVVAFTDADCVVDPGWLRALVAPLADPQIGVSGGRILAREPAGAIERFGETIHDHRQALCYRPPYAITMNWASPRRLFAELGGFDEHLLRGEDVDFSYRVFERGLGFACAPEAVVRHRNEHTLGGLLREGFTHGFHAVPVLRKHHRLILRQGYEVKFWRALAVPRGLLSPRVWRRRDRELFAAVFAAGKRAGRLWGSARFGWWGL